MPQYQDSPRSNTIQSVHPSSSDKKRCHTRAAAALLLLSPSSLSSPLSPSTPLTPNTTQMTFEGSLGNGGAHRSDLLWWRRLDVSLTRRPGRGWRPKYFCPPCNNNGIVKDTTIAQLLRERPICRPLQGVGDVVLPLLLHCCCPSPSSPSPPLFADCCFHHPRPCHHRWHCRCCCPWHCCCPPQQPKTIPSRQMRGSNCCHCCHVHIIIIGCLTISEHPFGSWFSRADGAQG